MNFPISNSAWTYYTSGNKFPTQEVHQRIQSFLEDFHFAQDELRKVLSYFSFPEVLPSECDQARDVLKKLQISANSLVHFLASAERLPDSIASERYDMLFHLYAIEQLTQQTLPLTSSFRSICLESSSSKRIRLQQQLSKYLGDIVEVSQNIEIASKSIL